MKKTEEILIVDDQQSNRVLLEVILKKTGYQFRSVESGEEALEFLETTLPALVLLDIMMPGIDGIRVAELVRETYSREELPIIMVTTMTESVDLAAAIAAGANDYVTKPVDRLVLLARIGNQLSLRKAHKEKTEKNTELERVLGIQREIDDQLPAGLLVYDAEGNIFHINQTLKNLCDCEGCSLEQVAEKLMGGGFKEDLEKLFEKHGNSLGGTKKYQLVSHGMDAQYLEVVHKTIPINESKPLNLWTFRDRTEERLIEKKQQDLIRLETVGTFTTGVAHNFNNVMASISGAADLMNSVVKEDARGQKCLDIIRRALDGGKALTQKMFALKPIDFQEGLDSVKIRELAETIIAEISEMDLGAEVNYNLNVHPKDLSLKVDPRNLTTIFTNLIANSADAVDKDGEVEVAVIYEKKKSSVQIVVADNGKGMSPKIKDRVSEPFFSTKNIDKINKISRLGNGLGMWNVHNLVLALGGSLDIRSAKGQGTEVVVKIPV